jgi:hypothetical protein
VHSPAEMRAFQGLKGTNCYTLLQKQPQPMIVEGVGAGGPKWT